MSRKSLQTRFMEALKARGETQVKITSKYRVFSRAKGGFYYLGSNGALRIGPTVSLSCPSNKRFREELLND